IDQFATLMAEMDAKDFRGKTVHFSALLRGAAITGQGVLWLRSDGPNGMEVLDNMAGRAIQADTDWNRYEATVEVSATAVSLAFGFMLSGAGEIWASDARLEAVEPRPRYAPDPSAWVSVPADFLIGADPTVVRCGRATAHVAVPSLPSGDAELTQSI